MEQTFLSRVSQLQVELKAPKDQTNQFGGYKYRSCEDILEAVKPLLEKQMLVLTLSDSVEQIGTRYYIRAVAILRDTQSDAQISNTAYAREAESKKGMDDSQITGTASSYARKYALNGLLCIDDTKDADTDEYKAGQNKPSDPGQNPNIHICDRCGQVIQGLIKNGEVIKTADEVAAYTIDTFRMPLCFSCMKALENARPGTAKNEIAY